LVFCFQNSPNTCDRPDSRILHRGEARAECFLPACSHEVTESFLDDRRDVPPDASDDELAEGLDQRQPEVQEVVRDSVVGAARIGPGGDRLNAMDQAEIAQGLDRRERS
jgi:hypothetical protein